MKEKPNIYHLIKNIYYLYQYIFLIIFANENEIQKVNRKIMTIGKRMDKCCST